MDFFLDTTTTNTTTPPNEDSSPVVRESSKRQHLIPNDHDENGVQIVVDQLGRQCFDASSNAQTLSTSSMSGYDGDHDDDIVVLPDDLSPVNDLAAPPDMDSLVAKQMANLSTEDREKVYFDIHGVSDEVAETPELVQIKLQEMNNEMRKLNDLRAYEMALEQNRAYVEDHALQLSFLRAELFIPSKAALRFARHWQAKLDLFGTELLTCDITQDDLDSSTIEALYSGLMQYLPLRDRAGRLVHVSFFHPDEVALQPKLRRVFYMCMASNEDEETQRKGRVAVGYLAGQDVTESPRNDWQIAKLLQALPVRMEAVHLCHDAQSIWTPIFSVFKYVVCLFLRLRIREHLGSHAECLFKLQTFGIPIHNCFPTIHGKGQIDKTDHTYFWEKRRRLERFRKEKTRRLAETISKEVQESIVEDTSKVTPTLPPPPAALSDSEASATTNGLRTLQPKPVDGHVQIPSNGGNTLMQSSIGVPGIHDVLLGRGKGFYQHKGNIQFRHWIESRSKEYDTAKTSSAKKEITREVMKLVQDQGGRFLKDDRKTGWVQVNPETARLKVAHVFRSLRAPPSSNADSSNARQGAKSDETNVGGQKRVRPD